MGSNPLPTMTFLPWLSLVAIIWLQSINGTNSVFSAYSSHLKSRLGITQVQLNNLAVASDAGKLFGWCSGVAAIYLPLPVVLLIGATVGFIGYGVPFLFLAGKIASFTYFHAVVLAVLAGNSICWINTVCYVASMRKFPADHGTVVALSTSYSALSAKIYIAVSQLVLRENPKVKDSVFLLLNSVTPLAVGLFLAPLLKDNKKPVTVTGTRVGFASLFFIAGATGVYSILVSVVPAFTITLLPQAILLVLLASIAVVPLVKVVKWVREERCKPVKVAEEVELGEVGLVGEGEVMGEGVREHGVGELLLSVDFWLYFWVYLCGGTLGLVYMNHLGQISQSRGVANSVLLSISSSFGFFGKLATAPISAFARCKFMVSRPASMALLMAPVVGSFFLLLHHSTTCLIVSTAIIGMCSSAMTSIAVSMTAELFGNKHFSVNHNILIANIPVGSFLFGYMAGHIYDKEASQEHGNGTCIGVQCYYTTFMLWGLICLMGTILSLILCYRTRNLLKPSGAA